MVTTSVSERTACFTLKQCCNCDREKLATSSRPEGVGVGGYHRGRNYHKGGGANEGQGRIRAGPRVTAGGGQAAGHGVSTHTLRLLGSKHTLSL